MKRPPMDVLAVLGPEPPALTDAEVSALLEIAYFTTAANGDLSDEECDAYRVAAPRLRVLGGAPARAPLTDKELRAEFDAFEIHLRNTTVDDRLQELARALPEGAPRERAYAVSYAFSLCDWETNADERRFLAALARALGLTSRAPSIERAAERALGL